jgi:hypothetical protein
MGTTYVTTQMTFEISAIVLFSILAIWLGYLALPKFRYWRKIVENQSLLEASFVILMLGCIVRVITHAIDWRGYRAIFPDPPREAIKQIGSMFFVSGFSLLVSLW